MDLRKLARQFAPGFRERESYQSWRIFVSLSPADFCILNGMSAGATFRPRRCPIQKLGLSLFPRSLRAKPEDSIEEIGASFRISIVRGAICPFGLLAGKNPPRE